MQFAEVMYARETHKPRGFGFVVFQNEKVAEKVCSEGQHVIDGKTVSATQYDLKFHRNPRYIHYYRWR